MISNDYTLVIKESILARTLLTDPFAADSALLADITRRAYGWERFSVRKGGFWEGSFTLSTAPPEGYEPTSPDLIGLIFYEKLGAHIQELSVGEGNLPTWEGYVHEMTLAASNTVRVRSYDSLANKLIVVNGTTVITTRSDNESILKYGEVQRIEKADMIDQTLSNLEDHLDGILEESATGKPEFLTTIQPTAVITLEVTVRGYIHTAAFKYLIASYNNQLWASVLSFTMLECDYLTLDRIDLNLTRITGDYADNCLKILISLASMGVPLTPFWRLFCLGGRKVSLEGVNTLEPDYYLAANGDWTDKPGNALNLAPRSVLPGMVEDTFFPFKASETVNSTNTFYVSRIGVDESGTLLPSTENPFEEIEQVKVAYGVAKESDYDPYS